jgi:hypothetical protein
MRRGNHAHEIRPGILQRPFGQPQKHITYIAFPNHLDYLRCKKQNQQQGRSTILSQYREFRLFLNAALSLNTVTYYLYSEHKGRITKTARE